MTFPTIRLSPTPIAAMCSGNPSSPATDERMQSRDATTFGWQGKWRERLGPSDGLTQSPQETIDLGAQALGVLRKLSGNADQA